MGESLPQEYPYAVEGADTKVMARDFDDRVDILPVSDPNVFSQAQRIALSQTKLQLAGAAPEMHNMYEVYRDMYDALGVRDAERIMKRVPDEEPMPKDPAQENIDALDMIELRAFEGQNHQAHIMAHLVFGTSPMVQGLPAVAMALQKHVMEHVRIEAKEKAVAAYFQQAQAANVQLPPEEEELQIEALVAQFVAEGMQNVKQLSAQISGQVPIRWSNSKSKSFRFGHKQSSPTRSLSKRNLICKRPTSVSGRINSSSVWLVRNVRHSRVLMQPCSESL